MCFIVFAYDCHPDYLLVLAANRDEYYARPTAPACFWDDAPHMLAGRDMKQSGTWMGINLRGRFAALTNYRDPASFKPDAPSRGNLVKGYLDTNDSTLTYIEKLGELNGDYNGYNLLLMDGNELWYYSNRTGKGMRINPGIHGLSNHLLDTPWPKVQKGKVMLRQVIEDCCEQPPKGLFKLLSDREQPADENLPRTGVNMEWERLLSSIFIQSDTYGTRSSTVLLIDRKGTVNFYERSFGSSGDQTGRDLHYIIRNWA